MPMYRTDDGGSWMHINFGRRQGPAPCVAPRIPSDNPKIGAHCGRLSVAVCDQVVGRDVDGKELTCDAPMCAKHQTKVGPDLDHCPRHAKQQALPGTV